jgi:hypothetical protein
VLAVEFETKERREGDIAAALARGLLIVGCGDKTVQMLPPLDVTQRGSELGDDLFAEAVA